MGWHAVLFGVCELLQFEALHRRQCKFALAVAVPTWHLPSSSHLIQTQSSLWALAHLQPLCLLEMMALLAGCPPLEDGGWRHICEGLFRRHAYNLQRTAAGAATEWRADAMTLTLWSVQQACTHFPLMTFARKALLPSPNLNFEIYGLLCVFVCLLLVNCSLQKSVASCSSQNSSVELITPHANSKTAACQWINHTSRQTCIWYAIFVQTLNLKPKAGY